MLDSETMGIVDDLFGVKGISAVVGVLVVVLVGLSKGWHVLVSERARRRESFLQMWDPVRADLDAFWLEGLVRYGYGVSLPAPVIRAFLATDHASPLLYRMVISHRKFVFEDGSLVWARRYRNQDARLALEFFLGFVAYFVLMFVGLKTILGGGGMQITIVGGVLCCLGIGCLVHAMQLVFAAGDYAYVVKHAPSVCRTAVLSKERAVERAKMRRDRAKAMLASAKHTIRSWWRDRGANSKAA